VVPKVVTVMGVMGKGLLSGGIVDSELIVSKMDMILDFVVF
jgi:hypothetical protein